jgi:tyrosyl-DNA phosphodiesterase-1
MNLPPIKILFPSLDTVERSVMGKPVGFTLDRRLVLNTDENVQGAGTMFCRQSQWNAATFPKDRFYDANSKRGGVMMHTKASILSLRKPYVGADCSLQMILGLWRPRTASIAASLKATPTASGSKGKKREVIEIEDTETEPESDSDVEVRAVEPEAAGWLYVGSHNFTPSAW